MVLLRIDDDLDAVGIVLNALALRNEEDIPIRVVTAWRDDPE